MTKVLIKYFLSILILFLSGFNHVLAAGLPLPLGDSDSSYLEYHSDQQTAEIVTSSYHSIKNRHHLEPYEVEFEEEDDEKTNSLKRQADTGKYLVVVSLALILGYFHKYTKRRSPSSEQSYHFSLCDWYLLFQVFRI